MCFLLLSRNVFVSCSICTSSSKKINVGPYKPIRKNGIDRFRFFSRIPRLVLVKTVLLNREAGTNERELATEIGEEEELEREAMEEISRARSTIVCILLLLSLCLVPRVLSKSPRPISDVEIRQKKSECYDDIESGLWGWKCKSSPIAKENCALRCLSPVCYELIYGSDPLEEGEKDLIRSQEYKYCMYKSSLGESLDSVRGSF